MLECHKCGDKFKTRQGLRGHEQFKHSNFVKVKMKKRKADRILIGDKVVRIDELVIDLDSAVKLKKLAMESECNIEEIIDQLEGFSYTECGNCGISRWAPDEGIKGENTFYCSYCGRRRSWNRG